MYFGTISSTLAYLTSYHHRMTHGKDCEDDYQNVAVVGISLLKEGMTYTYYILTSRNCCSGASVKLHNTKRTFLILGIC